MFDSKRSFERCPERLDTMPLGGMMTAAKKWMPFSRAL